MALLEVPITPRHDGAAAHRRSNWLAQFTRPDAVTVDAFLVSMQRMANYSSTFNRVVKVVACDLAFPFTGDCLTPLQDTCWLERNCISREGTAGRTTFPEGSANTETPINLLQILQIKLLQ
ncbi:MAG: hypothetical protein NVSMB34_05570 [Variovorax sp.]